MTDVATKAVIKLRPGEQYSALVETTEDGTEQTYYPKRFAVYWEAEKLQICQGFEPRTNDDSNPPNVITSVKGTARLKSDYYVSVIGEPKNKTATVELYIHQDDSPTLLKIDDHEPEPGLFFSPPYGRACMGFSRADLEIQSNDQWWLECRLHSSALRHLIGAIQNGTVERVTLSVRLNNLFTDEPPYVPYISSEHLFLRPSTKDDTIETPEMAHGWLEGLGLRLRSVDLSPMKEPEPEPDSEPSPVHNPSEVRDSDSSPVVQASKLMATHIDELHRTMKWIGSLIIVILLVLLFK